MVILQISIIFSRIYFTLHLFLCRSGAQVFTCRPSPLVAQATNRPHVHLNLYFLVVVPCIQLLTLACKCAYKYVFMIMKVWFDHHSAATNALAQVRSHSHLVGTFTFLTSICKKCYTALLSRRASRSSISCL